MRIGRSLLGRPLSGDVVGRNYCSSDGNLGGDAISGLSWQPLPATGA